MGLWRSDVGRGVFGACALDRELPPIAALRERFAETIWPHLATKSPLAARLAAPAPVVAAGYEGDAVRMAMWNLIAQSAGLPLHCLLGSERDRVRAYGSALDFPLSDAAAIEVFQSFDARGFTAVKVKSAHPTNPLHRMDFAGLVALEAAAPIDIVAHFALWAAAPSSTSVPPAAWRATRTMPLMQQQGGPDHADAMPGRQYGADAVRANTVSPGITMNPKVREIAAAEFSSFVAFEEAFLPRHCLSRLCMPHDLARAFPFLMSDEAAAIAGVNLVVDAASWPRRGDRRIPMKGNRSC